MLGFECFGSKCDARGSKAARFSLRLAVLTLMAGAMWNGAAHSAPGDCTTTIYSEDFEGPNGLNGWTLQNDLGTTVEGLWNLSTACQSGLMGHSATHTIAYADQTNCNYNVDMGFGPESHAGFIISPTIDLTAVTGAVVLHLNYFLNLQSGEDVAGLGISTDGLANIMALLTTMNGTLSTGMSTWQSAVVNLTPYVGSMVNLVFVMGTTVADQKTAAGFYVDDIVICNTLETPVPTDSPSPTPAPTDTASPTPTDSPSPTPEGSATPNPRDVGDFDGSGCTDISDFLFLLDNWQTVSSIGPPAISIADFLALLDNWRLGPNC